MPALHKLILIGMVGSILGGLTIAIAFGALFQIPSTFVIVDPKTFGDRQAGWIGGGAKPGGELLNDDDYIASWSPDLIGQTVSMEATVTVDPGALGRCILDSYRYDVSLNTGPGWVKVAELGHGNPGQAITAGTLTLPSRDWLIKSQTDNPIPDGSGLSVTAWVHCVGGDWVTMARDQARIEGGIGSVDFDRAQYTVADAARVTVEVPYVSDDQSGLGWSVFVFSTAQNRVVLGPTRVTQLRQTFSYIVSTSDFTTAAGCRNELTATLRNELWNKDFDTSTVIDVTGVGPSVRITGFTPAKPRQGDQVTVGFEALPNPLTLRPLEKIVVQWGFGGIEQDIVLPPDTREYTFTVGSAGTVHFEVIAYDSGCRPSPAAEVDIRVGEPPDTVAAGLSLVAILFLAVAGLTGLGTLLLTRGMELVLRIIIALVPILAVGFLIAAGVI